MTPKEIAHIAISRARNDFWKHLERLEFIREQPLKNADEGTIDYFKDQAFRSLISLCKQQRKGAQGITNRKVIIGDNRFYVVEGIRGNVISMNDSEPIAIRWIPDDLDEILLEFSSGLSDLCLMVEDIVSEYWIARKAGEVAKASVYVLFKDILNEMSSVIRILCRTEELWECILYSDSKEKSIAFLSGPGTIINDVARVLRETLSR